MGLKRAIDDGVIPGPRLLVSTRAIVATGSYGPRGFAPHVDPPLGAEAADGEELVHVVRDQIGKGADFIKVYADGFVGFASTDPLTAGIGGAAEVLPHYAGPFPTDALVIGIHKVNF